MKTALLAAVTIFAASSAFAEPLVFESSETPVTLIELFSSEGCSSCPPAEAWMSALKERPDLWKSVAPVVYHVDYWDSLGWPDRFASRAFTERQRRYASAWGTGSVYTPGFALNGREWRGWFGHEPPAPKSANVGKLRVTVRDRGRVEIAFAPAGAAPKSARVEVALLGSGLASDVKRGENGGRRLLHDFVALQLVSAALKFEENRLTATVSLPEKSVATPDALAAWVTSGDDLIPIQATGGWLRRP